MPGDPPGLDLGRLRAYLDDHRPGLVAGELSGTVIAGGRSNLTYNVTDGHVHLVVRRPPLGHVLATAHDMAREHRVMSALVPTPVPVPRTHALCEDDTVLGTPFYVMDKAPGKAFRHAEELAELGAARTRSISSTVTDTLADLHHVDPLEVGLADFGRPEGFLERQVHRWKKQLDASRTRDLAGIEVLFGYLRANVPPQSTTSIVHGDYRLDNLLIGAGDGVTAVLDWEMATIGDPLTDVALMVAYQQMAEHAGSGAVTDAPRAPGYLQVDEVLARYAGRSGRDLGAMDFYLALAYFKLAVILEGIHTRYTEGKTVGAGFADLGAMVEPLVATGLRAADMA